MKLSAVVTTKNEAANITRAVRSLHFADEVIVVDDFSEDQTTQIAENLGARIIQNRWEGYGQQKNVGLAQAQYDWVLFLDADEEVPSDLAIDIQAILENPKFDIYWLKTLDIFLGKPLRHITGHNPRLLRRGTARWTERAVHEQIVSTSSTQPVRLGDTTSGVLPHFLLHHGHQSINSYLRKMHRYTTLDAQQMMQTGYHRSGREIRATFTLPFMLAVRQFVKLAFWRWGILDGYQGMLWSVLSAYYEWEMGRKFLEQHTIEPSQHRT